VPGKKNQSRSALPLGALWLLLLLAAHCTLPAHAQQGVLYEKASKFGTIIVEEPERGTRILRFEKNGARQSLVRLGDPDYLALPYTRVTFVGLALCAEPRRLLVVGLGGGTLPSFLRKYYPDAVIDAVDVDPEVVYVAKTYFGFREDARMHAHVADGRRFIEQSREPYDAIFLDAFGADSVPPHLTTQEFMQAVRRALRPDGVVIGNVWGRYLNPLYDSMLRTYREVFDELYVVDVEASLNKIVLALPRKQPLARDEFIDRAHRVSTAKGFGFDLGALVDYGYTQARELEREAKVLRDGDGAGNGKW